MLRLFCWDILSRGRVEYGECNKDVQVAPCATKKAAPHFPEQLVCCIFQW